MFDILEHTGEKVFYRDRILATLANSPRDIDDYDANQLFDFARLFALQGDLEARQAIYNGFLMRISPDDFTGAATIIELDGIQGFLFVASHLGELALGNPDFVDDDYLLEQVEEQYGQETVTTAIQKAQADDPRVAAYIQVILETRSQRQHYRQERRIDPSTLSYSEIEEIIYNRRSGLALLWRWGQQASENDLRQIATKLHTETDPTIVRRLLAVFRKTPFPLDFHLLFALAQHADEQVAASATAALKIIVHPAVRTFALDMIAQVFRTGHMTALLAKNYQDGDWQLIEEITRRDLNPDDYHSLGFSVRDVFATHPTMDSTAALMKHTRSKLRGIVRLIHSFAASCGEFDPPWIKPIRKRAMRHVSGECRQMLTSACSHPALDDR
jgi:hypothetical protein